ncbi:MAG: hypothetical protein HRU34_06035 [Richelia sp.]|nr:hypothetical protein [Richelia sp.]
MSMVKTRLTSVVCICGTSINQVLGNLRELEELQESEVGQKIAQPERFIV